MRVLLCLGRVSFCWHRASSSLHVELFWRHDESISCRSAAHHFASPRRFAASADTTRHVRVFMAWICAWSGLYRRKEDPCCQCSSSFARSCRSRLVQHCAKSEIQIIILPRWVYRLTILQSNYISSTSSSHGQSQKPWHINIAPLPRRLACDLPLHVLSDEQLLRARVTPPIRLARARAPKLDAIIY
jgi:hypothetical protein